MSEAEEKRLRDLSKRIAEGVASWPDGKEEPHVIEARKKKLEGAPESTKKGWFW